MRVAICDDESVCLNYLNDILKQYDTIKLIHSFDNINRLLDSIEDGNRYDIIFMDIDWKIEEKNGIQYARDINILCPLTQIIFVTGYNDHYSQKIFTEDTNLCGYLVKPVQKEMLDFLLHKAERTFQTLKQEQLIIDLKKTTYAVPYRMIRYVESKGHQIIIHTNQEDITSYEKLENLKLQLPASFVQCHKSYLVNMNEICRIEGYELLLRNEVHIPVSKAKYNQTKESYFRYMRENLE